jgi:hypothetical protein
MNHFTPEEQVPAPDSRGTPSKLLLHQVLCQDKGRTSIRFREAVKALAQTLAELADRLEAVGANSQRTP